MSKPFDTLPDAASSPEDRLAALSPEERRRIGMGMRFLADLKLLYHEGLELGTDLLEGKEPAANVGMRMVDFERSLRLAANEILKRPMRVVHADAVRTGQTKVDESAWLTRVRIKAHEARRDREDKAREARFYPSAAAMPQPVVEVEAEADLCAGPRP